MQSPRCSYLFQDHFSDDQFEYWEDGKYGNRLKRDAVPNLIHGTRSGVLQVMPIMPLDDSEELRRRKRVEDDEDLEREDDSPVDDDDASAKDALSGLVPSLPSQENLPEPNPLVQNSPPLGIREGPTPAKKPRVFLIKKSSLPHLNLVTLNQTKGTTVLFAAPKPVVSDLKPTSTSPNAHNSKESDGSLPVKVLNGAEMQHINSALETDQVGKAFNLARIEMEENWVLFIPRTFSVLFGPEMQPIPGVVLVVQKHSGRFYLTVFLQVNGHDSE